MGAVPELIINKAPTPDQITAIKEHCTSFFTKSWQYDPLNALEASSRDELEEHQGQHFSDARSVQW